jgi:hypothetical protein
MTISFLSNSTASVLGAAAVGGAQTQLTLTANVPFELNDLVFVDWKTGETVNLNSVPVSSAFTSGPASQVLASDFPTATARYGTSAVGADGSLLVLAGASTYVNSTTNALVMAYKFSPKGVLLYKMVIAPIKNDTSAGGLSAVALSNGNFAIGWTSGASTTPTLHNWAILSPSLKVLYSGQSQTLYGIGYSLHMQPTNNGGFLDLTMLGIKYVSATGVATTIYAADDSNNFFAMQSEINSNGMTFDDGACASLSNYKPVSLSGGGFGYFLGSTKYGLLYVQVNADGTPRGAVVNVTSIAGANPTIQVSRSSTGNILWLLSTGNNCSYGVISDAGAVIKAAAPVTIWTANYAIGAVSDANGNFLITAGASDSYKMQYVTSAGLSLAGAATSIYPNSGTLGAYFNLSKLSTGTVIVFNVLYDYYSAFISLTGAVTVTSIWKSSTGNSGAQAATMILNDTVYGMCTVGSTSPELTAFSISNTGAVTITPTFLSAQVILNSGFRVLSDVTGKYLHVCAGAVVVTYDIATLTMIQSFATSANLAACHVRYFGGGLLYGGIDDNGYGRAGPIACGYLKLQPTVLLGVAANSAAKGDLVTVNTKGIFPVSAAWKYSAQLFDQSSNTPPGNSGSINSNMINLKGF